MSTVIFIIFVASIVLMVVGLLSSEALRPIVRRELNQRQIVGIFGGIALMSFTIFALIAEQPRPAPLPYGVDNDGEHEVTRVIDGDTFEVDYGGELETVRIIGIDAPETVHPGRAPECFGAEATAHLATLIMGEMVRLEIDASQDSRDRYQRLLRHVFVGEDNIAQLLLSGGYAYEYTHARAYEYRLDYLDAQTEARDQSRGLWAEDTCDGQRELAHGPAPEGVVKMSGSGICHAPGTTYYEITINFQPYGSLQNCLDAGGRLPQR